ncbi:MAG: hypothetical protein J6582_01060 [Snodgrassella sp.]|uniref:hypothetical protein n=1 Tax=Snodgrassella sp. TaxID=2815304 RepID=UPI00258E50E6|nr:hypothetical protein [Snodgrassella sp.]MCO6517503.1 hypothetical protein [Snodgrassella sp.]MCO6519614.1 hypothetical protein [Snodgrassella sp.]
MNTIKRTARMDIFIEEDRNTILIQQKWQYNWLTRATPWTIKEKRKFHQSADFLISKIWGNYFKLKIRGLSNFAVKHKNSIFTVDFDIKWVLTNPHWTVNVTKIAPGGFETSYVIWGQRMINLDTEDLKSTYQGYFDLKEYYQFPIAHEFGHTVGNIPIIGHSDEYHNNDSINGGFKLDYPSVMNIGNELRRRHLDYILKQLNTMLPNTTFYLI